MPITVILVWNWQSCQQVQNNAHNITGGITMKYCNKVIAAFSKDADTRQTQLETLARKGINVTLCTGAYIMANGEIETDFCVMMGFSDYLQIVGLFQDQESILYIADNGDCHLWYDTESYPWQDVGNVECIGKWKETDATTAIRSKGYTKIGGEYYIAE